MIKTRRVVQIATIVLVVVAVFAVGANCERWCPFGGVEALYTYCTSGDMLCSLGVSNFFILGGVLATALLVRRAFCGYLCPIGTISDWLRAIGQRLGIKCVKVHGTPDRILSLGKYVVLGVVLLATWRAGELVFRGYDPCYALISRHGADITWWAYAISAAIVVVSVFIAMPFCRWFCPLAAILSPFSRFGLTRVKRDREGCTDCGVCSERCPVAIPVHQVEQVTAARCISCLSCVESCPSNRNKGKSLVWGPPGRSRRRWPQAVLVTILLLCTTTAVAASYLFPMPSFVRTRGDRPGRVAAAELQVKNLTCRGRANLFFYFLERDDVMYQVPGYLKVEAWPDPNLADVRITYDPNLTDEAAIKRAIIEPYFDMDANFSRSSPFRIEGYDPLDLDMGILEGLLDE